MQNPRFAGSSAPAENAELAGFDLRFQTVDQESPQCLVAAFDQRVVNAGLPDPLLSEPGAQAAPKTEQVAVRVAGDKTFPGFNALGLDVTGHKLVPQFNRLVLTFLFVTDANPMALLIVHQGRVFGIRKAATAELYRCPDVHQRHIIQEQGKVVVGVGSACHFSGKPVVRWRRQYSGNGVFLLVAACFPDWSRVQ